MESTSVEYRISTECCEILYKKVGDGLDAKYYGWNIKDECWVESDSEFGVFCGFEPSRKITEKEAEAFVERAKNKQEN